ncbi:MAG TPA: hypothetical protein VF808_10740 [Ktedonobacterales bacterium]
MKNAGYGLAVLGVIIVVLGLLNHYVLRMNPVAHTSTILAGVGAVIAVVGLILTFVSGRSAS